MAPRNTSRRAFLEALGRAGGGTVVVRALSALGITVSAASCGGGGSSSASAATPPSTPAPPPSVGSPDPYPIPENWPSDVGNGTRVLILGAGIAGMSCAWEMARLGYNCTILEAGASAGGRCRTLRSGDRVEELDSTQFCEFDDDPEFYFNAGPARIPHHHEFILGYCRQFNIALEAFSNDNRAARLHSSSTFAGEPQLARRILSDSRGHIAQLLRSAVDQGALDQALNGADRNQLLAMLQEFGDLTAQGSYVGSTRAGYAGQEDAGKPQRDQPLPPLSLDAILDSKFWEFQLDYSQSINQQPSMLQPVGGMDKIARAFEQRTSDNIVYEAPVSAIRNTAQGVEVDYQRAGGEVQTLSADYCVCTIPATVLRSISHNFSTEHRFAIDNFEYSQSGKMAFQSRRFWEQDHNLYGGISWTDQDITQLWYPNNGLGQDEGVLVGSYTFGDGPGGRFANMTPQQRIDQATQQGQAIHRELPVEVRAGISVSWPQMPLQLGAWGISDPGILRHADGQVYFAGEHVSDLQGWQEGAVQSAYHAIEAMVLRDISSAQA
jgi:monoamine oxidase